MPKDHETTEETKETYYRHKRDLLQTQKRPTTDAKEVKNPATCTYTNALKYAWATASDEKRPRMRVKETYYTSDEPHREPRQRQPKISRLHTVIVKQKQKASKGVRTSGEDHDQSLRALASQAVRSCGRNSRFCIHGTFSLVNLIITPIVADSAFMAGTCACVRKRMSI
jgi:hypothetical protein